MAAINNSTTADSIDERLLPRGLAEMLRDFTLSVAKDQPTNLPQYSVEYFMRLRDKQVETMLVIPEEEAAKSAEATAAATVTNLTKTVDNPAGVRYGRRASVFAESYDPSKDVGADNVVVHAKSDAQRRRLTESVAGILLFRALDSEQMARVVDAMFERRVRKGGRIIEQGDDGDNFYVIDSGRFDVTVTREGKSRSVCIFDGKGFFGELALMYNMPRAATVTALTDGVLWAMDRISFRHIVLHSAFKKRTMYEQLLESVPMLKHLDDYERMNLADALTTRTFGNGERIIKEGDAADGIYFVEDGQARVTIRKNGHEVDVSKVTKGKYFGEKALVDNTPRTASVYAVGNVRVAFLDRESFERLLGPCINIMKREMKSYKKSSGS